MGTPFIAHLEPSKLSSTVYDRKKPHDQQDPSVSCATISSILDCFILIPLRLMLKAAGPYDPVADDSRESITLGGSCQISTPFCLSLMCL